jgi:hypothetical protein
LICGKSFLTGEKEKGAIVIFCNLLIIENLETQKLERSGKIGMRVTSG